MEYSKSGFDVPSNMTMFFGHQSVGYNLIAGFQEVYPDVPVYEKLPESDKPGLYHLFIGENEKPKQKMDEFAEHVKLLPEKGNMIAFMKLCYLDVDQYTDVEDLFGHYKSVVDIIKAERPDINLIHYTVPIVVRDSWPKRLIKGLFGRDAWGVLDNLQRYNYNELIRDEYGTMVFDIAALESTTPDGAMLTAKDKGTEYQVLFSGYSSDGSHLNSHGSKYIALKFIEFINSIY